MKYLIQYLQPHKSLCLQILAYDLDYKRNCFTITRKGVRGLCFAVRQVFCLVYAHRSIDMGFTCPCWIYADQTVCMR